MTLVIEYALHATHQKMRYIHAAHVLYHAWWERCGGWYELIWWEQNRTGPEIRDLNTENAFRKHFVQSILREVYCRAERGQKATMFKQQWLRFSAPFRQKRQLLFLLFSPFHWKWKVISKPFSFSLQRLLVWCLQRISRKRFPVAWSISCLLRPQELSLCNISLKTRCSRIYMSATDSAWRDRVW